MYNTYHLMKPHFATRTTVMLVLGNHICSPIKINKKDFSALIVHSYNKKLYSNHLFFKRSFHVDKLLKALRKTPLPPNPLSHNPPRVNPPIASVSFNSITSTYSNDKYAKIKNTLCKLIPSTKPYTKYTETTTLDAKTIMTLQGKEALVHFLQYFPTLQDEFIKDPAYFALYHKKLSENHPEILVRTYQLVLESSYNKKLFEENMLREIFDQIQFQDFAGLNKGYTDIGTFISALQTHHLYSQPGFVKHITACVVISPALDSSKLRNLPPNILTIMEQIKTATGNTINDLNLNGHYYDFKIASDPYYGRNHIMPFNVDKMMNKFNVISTRMLYTIKENIAKIKDLERSQQATSVDLYKKHYFETMQNKIIMLQQSNENDIQKYQAFNLFTFENLHKRPHDIFVPIFVPLTQESFQPNPLLTKAVDKITIPQTKVIQAPHIRQALLQSVGEWDAITRRKAFIDTGGTIGSDECD